MKNLKKIICSAIIMVIATIGIIEYSNAQIGGGISSPILWIINGSGDLTPSIASQPISVYDLEVTNAFTLGGTVGSGGIDMNGETIILDADADTSITADTDDQIDFEVSGADDFQMTANTFTVLSGSSIDANGNLITNIGNAGTDFDSNGGLTLASDLALIDDKKLYFDTSKSKYLEYSSDHGEIVFDTTLTTPGELFLYANTSADGSGNWEPYFNFTTSGYVDLQNITQGIAASRYFEINMNAGLRVNTTNGYSANIEADNIATADKTFQFPNYSGTFAMETMSNDLTLENGVLIIKETSTPSAVANYGKVYTKTDNKVYFQDGAGTEHEIVTTGAYYAEMYLDNNAVATTIETADTPIMLNHATTGAVAGWTFSTGSTGAITAYSDGTGKVNVASGTHGLSTGDEISIRGTTDYNGVWTITYIDADNFSIPDTWVNDNGASDWDEGSHLIAGTGAAGNYAMTFNLSCSEGGGAGSNVIGQIHINSTACGKCIAKRKFATNDYGNLPGTANITIADADKVYFTLNSSGTNAITCQYGNLNLNRL